MATDHRSIQRSGMGLSKPFRERSLLVRWATGISMFARRKPLGAFGALLIMVVLGFAVFTPLVQRVGPDEIARGGTSVCTAEQIDDASVECFSPELYEAAKSDATVRLRYPPSRFQPGSEGGVILTLAGPSSAHWLGTDSAGRDIWSRIVNGSRIALLVGLGGALIAVGFGTLFGIVSAFFGGWVDMMMQRVVDALQAFPSLILLLVLSQVVQRPNIYFTTLALGVIGVAATTRLARSAVLSAREEVYVLAAQTLGATPGRIMLRHILPNIVAPLIVIFTISIGGYILAEAGLAFLGLGDPTAVSWGKMVNDGRQLGPAHPSMALFVGTALTLTVLGFNLLGDALRDVLDPRLRGRGGRSTF